jgi:two-component system response regulator AtoC
VNSGEPSRVIEYRRRAVEETDDHRDREWSPSTQRLPETVLLICSPNGARAIPLREGTELVLGRAATSQLMLAEPSVSRVHARFTRQGDRVWVQDLGSRHGTWLQDRRIEREELQLGASVRIADTVLVLTRDVQRAPAGDPDALYLSPRMCELRELIARAARTPLPVLLLGETGTGKELAARALHLESARSRSKLHVMNCAAIPAQLIESTLFGHERGAFTGADRARRGMFEEAHGGTLFLDEVGELSLGAQAALLRVLETQRFTRVGSTRELHVDVRLIAATHRDLSAMVARGEFRIDLLHRLSVIAIGLPPLRERRDELAELARNMLRQAGDARALSPEALQRLHQYAWPGNLRELRNVLARASALGQGPRLEVHDLPDALRGAIVPGSYPSLSRAEPCGTLRAQLASAEQTELTRALTQTAGNQRRAAEMLGISLRTLERRLQRLRRESSA